MNLVEKVNSLTNEQKRQISVMAKEEMDKVLSAAEEARTMTRRVNIYQIAALRDMLNDKYCDPYVEVGTVNRVLEILDYRGHFEYNELTGKVIWRTK